MFKILEVDLDHVQRTVACLGQFLDGDELASDGPGAPVGQFNRMFAT